jgi:hypothetical protein
VLVKLCAYSPSLKLVWIKIIHLPFYKHHKVRDFLFHIFNKIGSYVLEKIVTRIYIIFVYNQPAYSAKSVFKLKFCNSPQTNIIQLEIFLFVFAKIWNTNAYSRKRIFWLKPWYLKLYEHDMLGTKFYFVSFKIFQHQACLFK